MEILELIFLFIKNIKLGLGEGGGKMYCSPSPAFGVRITYYTIYTVIEIIEIPPISLPSLRLRVSVICLNLRLLYNFPKFIFINSHWK